MALSPATWRASWQAFVAGLERLSGFACGHAFTRSGFRAEGRQCLCCFAGKVVALVIARIGSPRDVFAIAGEIP